MSKKATKPQHVDSASQAGGFKQRTSLLRRILMISLVPSISLGIILTFISAFLTNKSLADSYKSEAMSLATSYRQTIEYLVKSLDLQFSAVISNPEVVDETIPMTERKELLASLASITSFKDFSVAFADGSTYNQTNISEREYFKYAIEHKTSYVSSPVLRMTDNSLTLMMGKYFSYKGQDHLIYGGLDVDTFNDIIKDVNFGENSICYILDKDGVVIASSDSDVLPVLTSLVEDTPEEFAGIASFAGSMLNKNNDTARVQFNGEAYLFAYEPIPGNEGWAIAVGSNYAPIVRDMLFDIGIFAAIVVFGIILVVLICSIRARIICAPIVASAERLRSFAKGDISSPSPVSTLGDETEVMTNALGEMCGVIGGYITDISRVLTAIAGGDLTVQPQAEFAGDFGEIKSSLELILSSLNKTMQEVATSAVEVREGAEQLAEGSQTLSQNAITQASAVEEITSSVLGVAEKAEANNKNVEKALAQSQNTDRQAQEGTRCMEELLGAIGEIEASAQEIRNIINVIDDIAFQTNILALNAAIEAARAGTAGKGFAVVADEVRNLAGKSAQAAQQTGDLIMKSIEAVSRGTELAQATSAVLDGIVNGVEEMTGVMGDISRASDEQATAIQQVTTGMENVNAAIHNTSATAEQSAAASEELTALSHTLSDAVSSFKTE